MPDTSCPLLLTQDSVIDETVHPIDSEMTNLEEHRQPPTQDKSCAQSQFTDSGFGDDATMSLTQQSESQMSQQRPSDILVAAECVPDDIRLNAEINVEVNVAQQARSLQRQTESDEMKERVSTARVYGPEQYYNS